MRGPKAGTTSDERLIGIADASRAGLGRFIPFLRSRRPVIRHFLRLGEIEDAIDRRADEVARVYDDPLAAEFARVIYVESARAILQNLAVDELKDDVGVRPGQLLRNPRVR